MISVKKFKIGDRVRFKKKKGYAFEIVGTRYRSCYLRHYYTIKAVNVELNNRIVSNNKRRRYSIGEDIDIICHFEVAESNLIIKKIKATELAKKMYPNNKEEDGWLFV